MRLITIIVLSLLTLVQCASPSRARFPFGSRPPSKSPVRIAVVGDLQRTGRVEVWRERNVIQADLIKQVVHAKPDALVLLGDLVWSGESKVEWTYFDRIIRPAFRARIPTYPLYGNHEYLGDDDVAYQNLTSRFPVAKQRWYTVVTDSIAFVMLNTNFDEFSRDTAVKELRWFKTRMRQFTSDPSIRCIVVCGHHPPFTNSSIVQDEHILKQYFLPIFHKSHKSRLWLSGHSHAYEHFRDRDKHFVVTGGGGGPRHFVYVDEPSRKHEDLYAGEAIRPFHYVSLQRSGSDLNVEMIPLEGQGAKGDAFVIVPPSGRKEQ